MYYCAYVGSFGEFACNPRTLSSSHLNHMVSLEGIVTKCSLVRPKVVKSVHYNERKNTFHFREYRDQTMTANGAASTSVYPQEDEDGNPVGFYLDKLQRYCISRWLIISSLLLSTVTARIETIRLFPYKKCQKGLQPDNFPEASMLY